MRDIAVRQGKDICNINVSLILGKLVHTKEGSLRLLQNPLCVFQKDSPVFGKPHIASLPFKKMMFSSSSREAIERLREGWEILSSAAACRKC
mgnify:CR=1 FL=1